MARSEAASGISVGMIWCKSDTIGFGVVRPQLCTYQAKPLDIYKSTLLMVNE